jgi:hypothetical protein
MLKVLKNTRKKRRKKMRRKSIAKLRGFDSGT